MKLSDWLEQRAGLKGKKLEVALSGCETNMAESVEELRELADEENEKEFEKVIPQGMVRTALLKALRSDTHSGEEKVKEKASSLIAAHAKGKASSQ